MNNEQLLSRVVWLTLVVAGCSSSSSQTNYDDLRRAAAERQSGYPAPPSAENPGSWSTLLPDAGAPVNGGGNAPGQPSGAGGDQGAGGSFGAGGSIFGAGGSIFGAGGSVFGAGGFFGTGAVFGAGGSLPEGGTSSPADYPLTIYTTFSPGASGSVPSGPLDSSASVTGVTPSPLIYRPGITTNLQVSYMSSSYNVDAFSIEFGIESALRIPYSAASGYFTNTVGIGVTPGAGVCSSLTPGCYATTTNVAALTSQAPYPETTTASYSVPSVLVCGDCSSPGCAGLDPDCVGKGTPIACNALQAATASVIDLVTMPSTSGSASLLALTQGASARFVVTDDRGLQVLDTGCLTSATPGTPYSFSYSGRVAQVTLQVTTACNGPSTGSVTYELACQ